jgi:hypothetical protein
VDCWLITPDGFATQNVILGVAAVLGGIVLWKVIKNDDSVSPSVRPSVERPCTALAVPVIAVTEHF